MHPGLAKGPAANRLRLESSLCRAALIVPVELSAHRHTEVVVQHFRNGRWRRRACLLTAPDHRLENNGMTASSSGVRPASAQDAAACLAIYRPCVQNTAISWEIDVPTVAEMAARTGGLRATHEWLVLERDGRIIGLRMASR